MLDLSATDTKTTILCHPRFLKQLRNDFILALQAYAPEADIRAAFPGAQVTLGDYGVQSLALVPPFATVWRDFVGMITDRTAQLGGLNAPSSTQKCYAELFLLLNALVSWKDSMMIAIS